MHKLLESLSRWPGRRRTLDLFEARGFHLPSFYEAVALDVIGAENKERWNRYWDEVAMEHFCSAGRCSSARREFCGFRGEVAYRSQYLDDLSAEFLDEKGAFDGSALDSFVREFDEWRLTPQSASENNNVLLGQRLEQAKIDEIRALSISCTSNFKLKTDFRKYFEEYGGRCGFKRTGARWQKEIGGGLIFRFKLDPARKNTWTFQIPFCAEIYHKSDADFRNVNPDYLMVHAGAYFYELYSSPESGVLGAAALINFFDCIGEAIEGA